MIEDLYFEKNDFMDDTKKILFDIWTDGDRPEHEIIQKIMKNETKFN